MSENAKQEIMICKKCGNKEYVVGTKYCYKCGNKLIRVDQTEETYRYPQEGFIRKVTKKCIDRKVQCDETIYPYGHEVSVLPLLIALIVICLCIGAYVFQFR